MTRFEDFVEPAEALTEDVPALVLPADTSADEALSALEVVFGADDSRELCQLVIGGEDLGIVERSTALDLMATSSKGFGDGDGGLLPGFPLQDDLVELACPVPDCIVGPVYMVAYDEDRPPRCTLHTSAALVPVE